MTTQPATNSPIFTQLPLITNVAIYARPPVEREEEEETTYTQVTALVQFAHSLGYTPAQLTIFADTETEPAIERHERYQALMQAIKDGSVSVVFLEDVNTLFASVDETELNAFMHLCMLKGVFVVTQDRVYDFSNLTLVHQFRVDSTSKTSVFLIS